MTPLRSRLLRTAAAAVLAIGVAAPASAVVEPCRDWADCVQPYGPNSFYHLQPTGCLVPACTRPDASVCNTPQGSPLDPDCSCTYGFADEGSSCLLASCGSCSAGTCVSDDPDADGICTADDLCPGLGVDDDGDQDGDGAGDLCDDDDTVAFSLKTFQYQISTRNPAKGRPNGKIQAKGEFTYVGAPPSKILVTVRSEHPDAPFAHRWLLPCTTRGTRLQCEQRTDRNAPWIRVRLADRGASTQFDFKAQNLDLASVPTITPVEGVSPKKYLPAVVVVLPAHWQYPLDDYLTTPDAVTGLDLIRDEIGHAPAGWRCKRTPSSGTAKKLTCTKR